MHRAACLLYGKCSSQSTRALLSWAVTLTKPTNSSLQALWPELLLNWSCSSPEVRCDIKCEKLVGSNAIGPQGSHVRSYSTPYVLHVQGGNSLK